MGKGSTSEAVGRDFARAEAQRKRRDAANGLQFPSVWHALGFMFERGDAMQGALGRHPRGEVLPDGSTAIIDVDGGRGGSIDDVLATLQTIANAMADLRAQDPRAFEVLVAHVRDGKSYTEIGRAVGLAPSSVGALVGKGEYFLLGRLRDSVLFGGRP